VAIQDALAASPSAMPIPGIAVATIVWSSVEMNSTSSNGTSSMILRCAWGDAAVPGTGVSTVLIVVSRSPVETLFTTQK
jgi:hypothetical protein